MSMSPGMCFEWYPVEKLDGITSTPKLDAIKAGFDPTRVADEREYWITTRRWVDDEWSAPETYELDGTVVAEMVRRNGDECVYRIELTEHDVWEPVRQEINAAAEHIAAHTVYMGFLS